MQQFAILFMKGAFFLQKHILKHLPTPKKLALHILQCELPVILLWAIALFVRLLQDYQADPLGASHDFADCIEYIGASLVLSLMTAIFADLVLREQAEKDG